MKKSVMYMALLVCLLASLVSAAPVVVSSGDTALANGTQLGSTAVQWNTGINGGSAATANYNIAPNGAWYGPMGPGGTTNSTASKWVSFISNECAGPGCSGANPLTNDNYVSFFHTFTLTGSGSGILYVLADDTADVKITNANNLGGTTIFTSVQASGSACNVGEIGCLLGTRAEIELGSYLAAGVNTLEFKVYQNAGTGFGVNYYAEIVPEPGFYGALALGLGGLYLAVQRRRKAKV